MTQFGLGTFEQREGQDFIGVVVGDRVTPLHQLPGLAEAPTRMRALLEQGNTWIDRVAGEAAAVGARDGIPLAELTVLPPLEPRQIFCVGANYHKHVLDIVTAEAKRSLPPGKTEADMVADAERFMKERALTGEPFAWTKANSSLTGANDQVILPYDAEKPDWELELAVIIGRKARRVSRADALDYVAGYAIANDVTVRDRVYRQDMKKIGTDWLASKCAPSFLPLGPYIVPARFVPDPQALTITLKHNGHVMQNESTGDMIFGVPRLIEYISGLVNLLPGDVICTGSPAGNGEHHGVYLKPGDVMDAAITGAGITLGTQRNLCVAEERPA